MSGKIKNTLGNKRKLMFFLPFLFCSLIFAASGWAQAEGAPGEKQPASYNPADLPLPTDPLAGLKSTEKPKKDAAATASPAFSQVLLLISSLIRSILSVLGAIALAVFVYAGIKWMTAQGNPEQVKSASQIMLWAVLGVIMALGSYIILSFVFKIIAP
ncbi:MAG: hypothetical protein HY982_02060 [Candidatus Magasanikbacteria bacterium]|nr:hypothetical protein [Candidatus Magasanikbacteria bacterium]